MPTRREFLESATVTLLMIPLAACASSPPVTGVAPDAGANEDASSCSGVFTTSSNVSEHTHTLCVPATDLSTPPVNGNTYTSSTNLDPLNDVEHSHTVTLTAQQLASIDGGGAVTITSSNSDEHTHQFMITRAPT
ncbi:MAG TPA: hypothetical protein VGL81_16980 [Polyangiaceae bacterium]|jgi:hypothetical protein